MTTPHKCPFCNPAGLVRCDDGKDELYGVQYVHCPTCDGTKVLKERPQYDIDDPMAKSIRQQIEGGVVSREVRDP